MVVPWSISASTSTTSRTSTLSAVALTERNSGSCTTNRTWAS